MPYFFPPAPVYPSDYDSDQTLFVVYNTSETVTTAENQPWSDEISIKPVAADKDEIWSDEGGFANIDGELFYYGSVEYDGNSKINKFKQCCRNIGGTHTKRTLAGAEVRGFVIAEHHNQIVDAIVKIENFVGYNFTPDTASLDWRIRNLQNLEVIFDDFSCPDVVFDFFVIENNPTTGILAQYNITITGIFTSYRLDFGDGTYTTTSQNGTHRYAPNASIDPALTVANNKCTLVQTPIERLNVTEPTAQKPTTAFEIPIPALPTIPQFTVPTITVPSLVPQLPPIVFPCLNVGPIGPINIPSVISVIPGINIPSLVSITPVSLPSKITISPVTIPDKITINQPKIPDTITISPAPTIPNIKIDPVPTIPNIKFDTFPTFPTTIGFGPFPTFPTKFTFGSFPTFPTKFTFGPFPTYPTQFSFGDFPSFPTTIGFDPLSIPTSIGFDNVPNFPTSIPISFPKIPTIPVAPINVPAITVDFGPAPKFDPINITGTITVPTIEFGPAPTFPASIPFVNPPCLPAVIVITAAGIPTIPDTITITGPKIPDTIKFESPPAFPKVKFDNPPVFPKIQFDNAPKIPDKITFDNAPKIPTTIGFGPAPKFPDTINFGPNPLPSQITFGPNPLPKIIGFGPAPKLGPVEFGPHNLPAQINFGTAPTISVSWGTPPTVSCVVSVQCPSNTPFYKPASLFEEEKAYAPLEPLEVQMSDLGIPSEILVKVPEIPDIKILHDMPAVIRIESPNIPDIRIIGPATPIPSVIRIDAEGLPLAIELIAINLPSAIKLDTTGLPSTIKLDIPDQFPMIKLDASGIPDKIQVVGIPSAIELIGAPSEIKLVLPDKPEIELVYRGAPIDVKINLDISKLTGENSNAQCVAIVPCTN